MHEYGWLNHARGRKALISSGPVASWYKDYILPHEELDYFSLQHTSFPLEDHNTRYIVAFFSLSYWVIILDHDRLRR